ncbi:VOC family protein [Streptacidiphilus pinicola]|uniref:VOC family protein n=1 Tax=Streptacidiphilus pinicola TaxID=2219663 RepID=UPI001A9EECF0|nr:VOC family protein [Streptacidiphilus pinicola]
MSHDQHSPPASEQAAAGIRLNHTAVHASDRYLSAEFLAVLLGLEVGKPFGPFLPVDLGNGVTLDYCEKRDEPIQPQHYAFLVPEDAFDAVIARLDAVGVTYFADSGHTDPGRVNHMFGGRGAYFDDPDGHNMEIITRPYARP